MFTQGYDQTPSNSYSAVRASQFINFGVQHHSPQASLDDWGIGGYGRGTFTFKSNFELSLGVRVDHENKQADLRHVLQSADCCRQWRPRRKFLQRRVAFR